MELCSNNFVEKRLLDEASERCGGRSGAPTFAIGSMSGLHPHPGCSAYSQSKGALAMLGRQLAQEWAACAIRVNTVSLGMICTPLTEAVYQGAATKAQREALVPLGRIGQADDVAGAVAWLVSPGAVAYVTGQNLVVDGGVADHMLTMIPGRPAKLAANS